MCILFSDPFMEKVASILCSSHSRRPVPIQADRTFDLTIVFLSSFVIEGTFLQWKDKGKQAFLNPVKL